jgi:hypothetical protein
MSGQSSSEQQAREFIAVQLDHAGRVVQNREQTNLSAARRVPIRKELPADFSCVPGRWLHPLISGFV